jgi:DNA-binding transcriptional regulator YiaG
VHRDPQLDPGQLARRPVVQSALPRSELIRLRKKKGMTQEQVARNLEWSASKVIRMEGGRSPITKASWPGSHAHRTAARIPYP